MKKRRRKKKLNKESISLKSIIEKEIKENFLRKYFPKKVLEYSSNLSSKNFNNHQDFTHIPFVTIDGEESRDFDDAVWANFSEKKTKVMVAIADVSFYVSKNDPLDIEAKKRGNSFYFPDRVIPMFPEKISNNLCSLVPFEKRACLILEIDLNEQGEVLQTQIHRGYIVSQGRLTYNEVENIIKLKKKNQYSKIVSNLYNTFKILKKSSLARGKINFETKEYLINIQKENNFNFSKKERFDSHEIIEEFMILANTIIASLLIKKKVKTIFRNHEKPNKEKITLLKNILSENGFDVKRFNYNIPSDFSKTIKLIKKSKNLFFNDLLLKTQSKAIYESENKGHFGLALKKYTHFTSPIRRYSDLIVHRKIVEIFFLKKINVENENISVHLTTQEKKADLIERNILEKACSLYLKKLKHQQFIGIIDAIEDFGFFVKSIELPFSGLARFKKYFDEKNFSKDLKVGQLVKFKIKKNNIQNGKILLNKVRLNNDIKKDEKNFSS